MSVLVVPSPIGALLLREDAGSLVEVAFVSPTFSQAPPFESELAAARTLADGVSTFDQSATPPILRRAAVQLAEYFAGTRIRFALPLAPVGTEFQRRVWAATAAIPFGETATYGAVARTLGLPRGARAVGGALNRNPLAIVVPCHRVVGSSGRLTGYDGGLTRKAFLLNHERPKTPRLF